MANNQRSQFGYIPTNTGGNQFNTEFQGNSIGQPQNYMQGQQQSPYGGGYSMPQGQQATSTSYQQYMDKSFTTGATSEDFTNTAGAIPGYGTAIQAVDSVLGPVQDNLMSINSKTGAYDDMGDAQWGEAMGTMLDPGSHALDTFNDPDASSGEKALSAVNVIFPGIGNIGAKSRLEEDEKKNIALADKAKAEEQAVLDKRITDQIRNQRLNSFQQNQPSYGAVFKNGGMMKSYPNGGLMNPNDNPQSRPVNVDFKDASGSPYYPSLGTSQVIQNSEYMPIGRDDNGRPLFATQNQQLSDSIGSAPGNIYHPQRGLNIGGSQTLQNLYSNPIDYNQMMDSTIRQDYTGKFNQKANGGFMEGVDKNPDVTYFNGNQTHENSPLGGIPQGPNANVESDEFKVKLDGGKEYIFTSRF